MRVSLLALGAAASLRSASAGLLPAQPYAPLSGATAAAGQCDFFDFTDPFVCPPPELNASVADEGLVALTLTYWRESTADTYGGVNGQKDCLTSASPQFRGTWLYATFNGTALLAQPPVDPTQDITQLVRGGLRPP